MSDANNLNSDAVILKIKVCRNSRRSRATEPTFPCPLCPNNYTAKGDLMSHISVEHPCLIDEHGRSKFDASPYAYQKLVSDMINLSAQPGSSQNSLKLCLDSANKIEQMVITLPANCLGEIAQNQQPNESTDISGDDNSSGPTIP